MLSYALRRFCFAVVGLLLFTLPIFAFIRLDMHNKTYCDVQECVGTGAPWDRPLLLRNGPFYATWQTGTPPHDYWPLALALLAAGGAVQFATNRRSPQSLDKIVER